jgi:hypothetical protein
MENRIKKKPKKKILVGYDVRVPYLLMIFNIINIINIRYFIILIK